MSSDEAELGWNPTHEVENIGSHIGNGGEFDPESTPMIQHIGKQVLVNGEHYADAATPEAAAKIAAALRARDSIADYLEARASKLRGHAERGDYGWALARHDATLIDALASDVRNELDVEAGNG